MNRIFAPVMCVLLLWSLLFSGCAALMKYGQEYKHAEKAYDAGDYDRAVYKCVASLQAKPDYDKAITLLKNVAPLAYKRHREAAAGYERRTQWDEAVAEYDALIQLVNSVSSVRGEFPTVNVGDERGRAAQHAAEAHYQSGLSLMRAGRSKEAAVEFRQAQDFVSTYKDAQTLYEKTRRAAIKRIAVMPFEDVTGKTQFGDMGALLTSQIISAALSSQPEFLEFVTREYLEQVVQEQQIGLTGVIDVHTAAQLGKVLGIHAFVFGKVLSVTTNYPSETTTQYSNTEEVSQGKGKPKLKVSATWAVHKKEGSVNVAASFQVVDVRTGTIVIAETVQQKETDEAIWARYSGDERALTYEASKLCAQTDTHVDPPEVLAHKALTELGQALASKLVQFFK